jgi:carbonic anhydrase/acetyltransferase-like protein (isoleucine patch superfamily)
MPRDIFSEPGLVAYIDPKLCNRIFFVAHIAIYHTAEIVYRPNWNNDGEHMVGGCIMNAVVGRHGHVSIHSHVKATDNNAFNDSEMIWGSRQAAVNLLREAALQFIQYFPNPGDPV